MKNDTIVTIDNEYRFTIPQALRNTLGWHPGIQLALLSQPDGTVLIEELPGSDAPVS